MSDRTTTYVTQYTAWLEVDLDSSDRDFYQELSQYDIPYSLEATQKIRIPLTAFTITAGVDDIPQATVQVATGRDITAPKRDYSPIHDLLKNPAMSRGDYVHASIMFRNAATGTQACIFDGFLLSKAPTYTISGLHLTFHLKHWAVILSVCPVVCTSLTAESASWSAHFLHKKIDADSTGSGGGSTSSSLKWATVVRETTQKLKSGQGPIVSSLFQPVLEKLHEHNSADAVKIPGLEGQFIPSEGKLPSGYRIKDLLASGASEKFSVPGARETSAFPGLNLRTDLPFPDGKTLRSQLVDHIITGLGDMQVLQGTAWSFLQRWAWQFRLAIVPRVHEIQFIPLWEVIPSGNRKFLELTDLISVTGGSSMVDPAACMIALSSDEAPKVVNSAKFFDWLMGAGSSRRGAYKPPKKLTGPVGISIMPPMLSSYPQNPSGMVKNIVALRYAESEFWTRHYMASAATILSPIRFDVCPGSTVQFGTGTHSLSTMENLGYVRKVDWMFNTSQGASCTFDLGFVRPSPSTDGLNEHMYYDTQEPFLQDSWTADSFKTF